MPAAAAHGGWEDPAASLERAEHAPIARYGEIAQTLVRHGFGYLLGQLGIWCPSPRRSGARGERPTPSCSRAERVRLVCEDLGATFIKLGQILSSRPDLLPPDIAAELARLQDAVPPEPMGVVEATINRELGRPWTTVFARIDPQPLGSASIGQVHAARLLTGEEVVVKVQRPGVEERIEEDLAVLGELARLAQTRTSWGRVHNLTAMVEEFATTLRGELDYVREGHNAERIAHNLACEPTLRVPAIYWSCTTRRLLTMERIPGIKISDTQALGAAGHDLPALSATLLRLSLKMVLEDGFYHADPHPGNLVVGPGGVIGLLDYGMVGVLDRQTRDDVLYLLLAVVRQDTDRVVDQLLALGIVGSTLELERMKREVAHLLSPGPGTATQTDIRRFLDGLLALAYRRQLIVPAHLVLMSKTIMMHEALARACDPQCNTAEVLGGHARLVALRANLPHQRAARLLPALLDMSRLALALPRRVHRLLLQAEQGHLSVNIRLQDTDRILDSLSSLAQRLILAIVAGGFVVGAALLLQTYGSSLRWLVALYLLAGTVGVAALAAWAIVALLRRHRR